MSGRAAGGGSAGNARGEPTFFATPEELRAWFAAHHGSERELLVGFHKVATGRPSVTWPQAVDEALCVGWIDGVRRSLGAESYVIRFTPRKPASIWSAVNIRRIEELIAAGRVLPAGLAAFERRRDDRSAVYSYERRHAATLDPEAEAAFRAHPEAWAWFAAQAPSYRRPCLHWVTSAKREETRRRRLEELIRACAERRPIGPLRQAKTRPG